MATANDPTPPIAPAGGDLQWAELMIQCRPPGMIAPGSYLRHPDHISEAGCLTPVFEDLYELVMWNVLGGKVWTEVPWDRVELPDRMAKRKGAVYYCRPRDKAPRYRPFRQTWTALRAYDEAEASIEARWHGDLGQMQAADADNRRHIDAVREAFWRDTAHLNGRDHAYKIDVVPRQRELEMIARGGKKTHLRMWVDNWLSGGNPQEA